MALSIALCGCIISCILYFDECSNLLDMPANFAITNGRATVAESGKRISLMN